MSKIILIHANCNDPKAKGDYTFAAMLAKDLVCELKNQSIMAVDVMLVSTQSGLLQFESLYGPTVNGRVNVENTSVGLSSLDTFDAVKYCVLGFIDANRCKYSPAELVKRVLSPESKLLFVGNANQLSFYGDEAQSIILTKFIKQQPGLYDAFDKEDLLIGSAGLGSERLGLPTMTKADDLLLDAPQTDMLPSGKYGFMYLAAENKPRDYQLMTQYMKLAGQDRYVLVGNFQERHEQLKLAYESDTTLAITSPIFPAIDYYQSFPNAVMRKAAAKTQGHLVLSTGIGSVLEVMQDGKLAYYQDRKQNEQFVETYLIAVKSLVANETVFNGCMPELIIELAELLFEAKPLNKHAMERTQTLLAQPDVAPQLIATNQTIVNQASGKIASKLLGFLTGPRKTRDSAQCDHVCASIKQPNEKNAPAPSVALRRTAASGALFELKVLIRAMRAHGLDDPDGLFRYTALHWAVNGKNLGGVRLLVNAGASLDSVDSDNKTPLHWAIVLGNKPIIEELVKAGASLSIADNKGMTPLHLAAEKNLVSFIETCQTSMSAAVLK